MSNDQQTWKFVLIMWMQLFYVILGKTVKRYKSCKISAQKLKRLTSQIYIQNNNRKVS